MTLSSGTRLGPYEILAPLGAGGMGEVYRARNTRLERTVPSASVLMALPTETPLTRRMMSVPVRSSPTLEVGTSVLHPAF